MLSISACMPAYAPSQRPEPVDITPIILIAHLLGLVMATATITGLVPVAIVLLRALL